MSEEIFLGNGAIALGLLEAGCQVVASYPGTPSSEILPEVVRLVKANDLNTYTEWSTNEKVALDVAFSASITGKRSACCMKQVGLNVAADSLMSAAYMGTTGGLVIITCDDPGPHSSQTEQDSRFMARLAKVPVLDPSNPQEAREMARLALEISEDFKIPVVLRPAIRVCHARQSLTIGSIPQDDRKASFKKDPQRWAATPKFRLVLHEELNQKLTRIADKFETLMPYNGHNLLKGKHYPLGIITAGVPYAVIQDILSEEDRVDIPVLKLGCPYPFPEKLADDFMAACDKVLVIEETDTFIEYLLRDRRKTLGRLTGHIPSQGELVPEVVYARINRTLGELGLTPLQDQEQSHLSDLVTDLPVRKPTLCPACPHRAAFYSIRKTLPKAIFTSDIGCYTLGINQGVVDTCLDMGAAITMASGFYQAHGQDKKDQTIVATIGDSTFYHSGPPGLLNAVYNNARFILVILDNQTTAMTGMQPTPGLGIRADGSVGKGISLERIVAGCGVDYIEVVDPYEIELMNKALKKASEYIIEPEGGIAVIIARHPCVIAYRDTAVQEKKTVIVTEDCLDCNLCLDRFGCPALFHNQETGRMDVDRKICVDCGLCLQVCPKNAIVEVQGIEA